MVLESRITVLYFVAGDPYLHSTVINNKYAKSIRVFKHDRQFFPILTMKYINKAL